MPTTVDERVVEMRFDNRNFEKNVKESISSLDKLKSALSFKSSNDVFDKLERQSHKVKLDGLTSAIDTVNKKFSMMEMVAFSAINRIVNQAMSAGERLVKSLSIDQLTDGFQKYSEKSTSVVTIMNATGLSIDKVSDSLDRLMTFTDETSFSFNDMVSNIGKFTSQGQDLEKSVNAMQGIGVWASLSGQGAAEASRAMYNLAQSMGVGAVKLMDWKSIENANMATKEFKETAIETAVAMGTLKKTSDGVYKDMKNNTVTVKNFSQTLSDGWFSSEVLMKTLDKYGGFATRMLQILDETELSGATEFLRYLDQYEKGTIDIAQAARSAGMDVEEFKEYLEELSDEQYELGKKAFKAAQEYRTFADVISATKDAVSSGWMQSFELIFGNYEEAKQLWSTVGEALYNIFAASKEARNGMLQLWKELGGRRDLLIGVASILSTIADIGHAIKLAFQDTFLFGTADDPIKERANALVEICKRIREFGEALLENEEFMNGVYWTARGIFEVLKMGLTVVKTVFKVISPLIVTAGKIAIVVTKALGGIGQWITETINLEAVLNGLGKVLSVIFGTIGGIIYLIANIILGLATLISKIPLVTTVFKFLGKAIAAVITAVVGFIAAIKTLISLGIDAVPYIIGRIIQKMEDLKAAFHANWLVKDYLTPLFNNVLNIINKILSPFKIFVDYFKTFYARAKELYQEKGIAGIFEAMKESINGIKQTFLDFIRQFVYFDEETKQLRSPIEWVDKLIDGIRRLREELTPGRIALVAFSSTLLALALSLKKTFDSFSYAANSVGGFFTTYTKLAKKLTMKSNVIINTATAIAILAGSLYMLAQADEKKVQSVAITLGVLVAAITGVIAVAGAISKFVGLGDSLKAISIGLLALSGSMVILGSAMLIIDKITVDDFKEFAKKLGILSAASALLIGVAALVSHFVSKSKATLVGAAYMLLFSLSIVNIAETLKTIATIPADKIVESFKALSFLFVALGVMAAGIGQIRISSLIGWLGIVTILNKNADLMFKLADHDYTSLLNQLDIYKEAIVRVGGVVAAIILVAGVALKQIKHLSRLILAITASFAAIVGLAYLIEKFEIWPNTIEKLTGLYDSMMAMASILVLCTSIASVVPQGADNFSKNFLNISKMFKSLAIMMGMMALVGMAITKGYVTDEAWKMMSHTVECIIGILGAIGVVAAKYGKEGGSAFKDVSKAIIGLAAIMFMLLPLSLIASDEKTLKGLLWATGIIGVILLAIGKMVDLMNKNSKDVSHVNVKKYMGLLSFAGVIIAFFGSIALLYQTVQMNGFDLATTVLIGAVIASFIGILFAVNALVKNMKNLNKNAPKLFESLALVFISFGTVIASLAFLKDIEVENLGIGLAVIAMLDIAIVAIGNVVKEIARSGLARNGIDKAIASISAVIASFAIVMVSLKAIENVPVTNILASLGGLIAIIFTLASTLKELVKIRNVTGNHFLKIAGSMAMVVGSLAVLMLSFKAIENVNGWKVAGTLLSLAILIGALGGIMTLIAKNSKNDWINVLSIGISMSLVVSMLAVLVYNLSKIPTNMPWETMLSVLGGLSAIILSLGAMFTLIAIFGQKSTGTILAAGASMGLVVSMLGVLAYNLAKLPTNIDPEAIKSTLNGFKGILITLGVIFGAMAVIGMATEGIGVAAVGVTAIAIAAVLGVLAAAFYNFGNMMVKIGDSLVKSADFLERFAPAIKNVFVTFSEVDLTAVAGGLTAVYEELKKYSKLKSDKLLEVSDALDKLAPAVAAIISSMAMAGEANFASFTDELERLITATNKIGANTPAIISAYAGSLLLLGNTMKSAGYSAGVDGALGLASGLSSSAGINKLKKSTNTMYKEGFDKPFRKVSGWHSPWEQTIKAGKDAIGGLIKGLNSTTPLGLLKTASEKVAQEGVVNTIQNTIDKGLKKVGINVGDLKKTFESGDVASGFNDFISKLKEDIEFEPEDMLKGTDSLSSAFDSVSESASQAHSELDDFLSAVKSGINIFSKFDAKTELTSAELLDNMASQVAGVTEWGNMLAQLESRGMDKDLLKKLAMEGPGNYEQVNAFAKMTDSQLVEAGKLYQDSLTLPQSIADMLHIEWKTTGEKSGGGYAQGLDESKEEVEKETEKVLTAAQKILEKHVGEWKVSGDKSVKGYDLSLALGEEDIFSTLADLTDQTEEELKAATEKWIEEAGRGPEYYAGTLKEKNQIIYEAMADMLGIPAEVLQASVLDWNAASGKHADALVEAWNSNDGSKYKEAVAKYLGITKEEFDKRALEAYNQGKLTTDEYTHGVQNEESVYLVEKAAEAISGITIGEFRKLAESAEVEKAGTDTAKKLNEGITSSEAEADTKKKTSSFIDSIVNFLNGNVSCKSKELHNIGKMAVEGVNKGLEDPEARGKIKKSTEAIAKGIVDNTKEALDVHSPSRIMMSIGSYIVDGLAIGMEDSSSKLDDVTTGIATDIITGLDAALNGDDISGMAPSISPVLDLSGMTATNADLKDILDPKYQKDVSNILEYSGGDVYEALSRIANKDNSDVVGSINALREDIATLTEQMTQMQIVMDSGVLVGEVTAPIDLNLGERSVRNGRERMATY